MKINDCIHQQGEVQKLSGENSLGARNFVLYVLIDRNIVSGIKVVPVI